MSEIIKPECPTCNDTGKEGRHSICRDCDEIVRAVCEAVILGEDEEYLPVHLEPREARLAIETAHASLIEERDRLREENERLLSFVQSFKFTCIEGSFYKDCYLSIVEPDSVSFRLGNGSQFSQFIGKLEERRAALSPLTAEGREP